MWAVPDNISVLQREDETLKHLFAKVVVEAKYDCVGRERFIVDRDVLYMVNNDQKRLVVPANCRSLVMHLVHTFPWSRNLGHKTYLRISLCFYWPSMNADIQRYCATCPTCQKTCAACKSDRALLQPLPVISTPFRRIALDIAGPLVRSSGRHEYILVVCDYSTHFPEAFLLAHDHITCCGAGVGPTFFQGGNTR